VFTSCNPPASSFFSQIKAVWLSVIVPSPLSTKRTAAVTVVLGVVVPVWVGVCVLVGVSVAVWVGVCVLVGL
jgi:hypothetical protein